MELPEIVMMAETGAHIATALMLLAVIVGGVIGLRRYRHSLRIKSAELLLQMEDEFRNVSRTCLLWELPGSYEASIKKTLSKALTNSPLSDEDLELLGEVDRALRFFYLCTVLHFDLRIEEAIVARSYYWYASRLLDEDKRPELHQYVKTCYRRLHDWLVCHQACFRHYQNSGQWQPRLSTRIPSRPSPSQANPSRA